MALTGSHSISDRFSDRILIRFWMPLGRLLRLLGAVFGPPWVALGRSRRALGLFLASASSLGASWALLEHPRIVFRHLGNVLKAASCRFELLSGLSCSSWGGLLKATVACRFAVFCCRVLLGPALCSNIVSNCKLLILGFVSGLSWSLFLGSWQVPCDADCGALSAKPCSSGALHGTSLQIASCTSVKCCL